MIVIILNKRKKIILIREVRKICRTQLKICKALEHSKNKCLIDFSCFSQSVHIEHIDKPLF